MLASTSARLANKLGLKRSLRTGAGCFLLREGSGRCRFFFVVGFGVVFAVVFAGSRFRVGLLALPLPGAGVTFFAAAKKVTKETAIPSLSTSHRPRHRRLA